MCGSYTQEYYINLTEDIASSYILLATKYNDQGQRAITTSDGDVPRAEWVRNVYSADGRDHSLFDVEEDGKTQREQAAEALAARGFTYDENPVEKYAQMDSGERRKARRTTSRATRRALANDPTIDQPYQEAELATV